MFNVHTEFAPDVLSEKAGQSVGRFLKLLHPKYGASKFLYVCGCCVVARTTMNVTFGCAGTPFIVLRAGDKFMELQTGKMRKYSSWFVNQRVVSGVHRLFVAVVVSFVAVA